ncbi:hypothetical protein LB467_10165 [Salegentibacter sp. JZCK2]|uniref:hypothetical protein n=1 Tax=Salegentibacter tibetensis TaxID=2873600 RepID=UPI001CCEE058|nr:hypothetical protein [Salegentibacter tibetensis]MBZ9730050.1 hypothetical protein [Salegentibacter tibetensis]
MELTILFETIKIGLVVLAAFFTYYKFFREGSHRQRIEFDIDFQNLGVKNSDRIIELGAIAENKGNVEQKFKSMRLRIRGIDKDSELKELDNYKPRLAFPIDLETNWEMIPEKFNYFFVRPGVKQRFPIVTKIPSNWTHILVKISFKYKGTRDIHTTERAFRIGN